MRVKGKALTHERFGMHKAPTIFYPVLVIAAGALSDIVGGRDKPTWEAAAGLLAFCALYLFSLWAAFSDRCGRLLVITPAVVLTALTLTLALRFGAGMVWLFSLLAVVWSAVASWRHLLHPPLVIGLVSFTAGMTAVYADAEVGDAIVISYSTLLSGVIVTIIVRLFSTVMELRQAQEELAHSAVAEERLRFARDLHDLLGHSISLIVVKAEAVRRFAECDPATVKRHAQDIEAVGRTSLEEIREAISGYRERDLNSELKGAKLALTDAGIETEIVHDGPPLPVQADALLGWVVREGVTNVIRHSEARHCEISVRHRSEGVELEIRNDGPRTKPPAAENDGGTPGHGLLGLAERLSAAGGALTTAPGVDGGFRLTARLPVARRSEVRVGAQ
ncbi:two-component system sensor histidine kinase DesK [Streptomyces sp. BK340]|nr:two-component system sensor histidine kinase DesK [Streptomyces sp. BK340]